MILIKIVMAHLKFPRFIFIRRSSDEKQMMINERNMAVATGVDILTEVTYNIVIN